MLYSPTNTREIRNKYVGMRDKQIGAAGKVGDETDASVGLSDDSNTKNRSVGQAGSLD